MGIFGHLLKNIQDEMEDLIKVNVLGINYPIYTTQTIYDEYLKWYENAITQNEKSIHQPAIGESFSLKLTPTSLGMAYVVINNYTKDKFNLTYYGSW